MENKGSGSEEDHEPEKPKTKISKKLPNEHDDKIAKSVSVPGNLARHSPPVLASGEDEKEQQGQVSEALMPATTTIRTTNTQNNKNTKIPASKYTLEHARTIDNHSLTNQELKSKDKIPDYIFKTLMIVNYHVHEFELNLTECNNDPNKKEENKINPMDAILGIFYCSDDLLRRYLCNKLSACQLSVPFVLPDPDAPSENITTLLSALENITKCWKDGTDTKQVFATEHPFPVVSFIRIGKPKMSKSLLINKIMSFGSRGYNHFFHKDMKGGHVKRKIIDGLVELSWYLPGESEDQTLKKEICFANLRGDAEKFKKQLNLLLEISSVLFILLPSKFRKDKGEAIPEKELEQTKQARAKTILIFKKEIETDARRYFEDSKFPSIFPTEEDNENRYLQRIRKSIEINIGKVEALPLMALQYGKSEYSIHLDVPQQMHLETEKSLCNWLNLKNGNPKNLLRLQAHVPVLAELEREKYHPKCLSSNSSNDGITQIVAIIYEKIREEEMAQKNSLDEMNDEVLDCLNYIATIDKARRNYFLSYLKHHLNKMTLQTMHKLHEEYIKAKLKFQKERNESTHHSDTQSSELQNLKNLDESFSKNSFGLEHIIRELAQLYQIGESKYDYAGAAADMLLSGQPLEILDGDSFYIPLQWFKAVFTKLEQKTKNAKIYVISVVGIQSSGKSTMLNTMFGLELPVSAGRCTRGVFASLIPVSDSLKSASKFDYILIVDTEGLTGSTDPELRKHDNKLATFAIGVADVTIVNIGGENQNEMKEFLEIAVQAFLKMNIVEKKKKSCKITHQNVEAADARERLARKRCDLKEDLDKITRIAAWQENREQEYHTFDDIISFHKDEDVFYMPHLLEGSPPMASVNPEYGRAVQRVKENIINLTYSQEIIKISFSQFRERVCNLWEAMLKENFIFCFRNIIEVRAFTALDRKYLLESVNVMAIGMSEFQTNVEVALKRCSTKTQRRDEWKEQEKEIREEGQRLAEKMKEAMNEFFKTNQDKETLEQWKGYVMNKIEAEKETQVRQIHSDCLLTFEYLQSLQDVEVMKQDCEAMLVEKTKLFIRSVGDINDKEKIKMAFEKQWQEWIEGIPECKVSKANVNDEMVYVLRSTDSSLEAEIGEKLTEKNNNILNFQKNDAPVKANQLVRPVDTFKNFFSRKILSDAEEIEERAALKAFYFALRALNSGFRCTRNVLTQMYHNVITAIEEETKEMRNSVKCDILLYAFAETYELFNEMEERFIEERDIRGDLERNLRPMLKKYFESVCENMGKELLAATFFVEALEIPIESAVNNIMGRTVAREMLNVVPYKSKSQFHAHVLIQLGQESNFDSYTPYLANPVNFLRTKLIESIEKYCLNHVKSILEDTITGVQNNILAAIKTANEKTRAENKKLTFWIQQFVKECSTLVINEKTFALAAIEHVENMKVFQKEVRREVNNYVQSLLKRGLDVKTIRTWNPSPGDILFNKILGCESVCPFCKALCDHTVSNHAGKHLTQSHRPEGVSGYHDVKSKVLVTDICTMSVAGKGTFRNDDTSQKNHPYKDYQSVNDYYNSWSIAPNPSFESSKYFQWFMATFSKELAEHYKVKEPNIPEAWKRVKFNEAKEDLEHKYHL